MESESSIPIIVPGEITGAVLVVVTCTLHDFGQISLMVWRIILDIPSDGGSKVTIPELLTD